MDALHRAMVSNRECALREGAGCETEQHTEQNKTPYGQSDQLKTVKDCDAQVQTEKQHPIRQGDNRVCATMYHCSVVTYEGLPIIQCGFLNKPVIGR